MFGTLLSGLFALTAMGMRQYLENALINETLVSDLDEWLDQIQAGAPAEDIGFSSRYYAWTGRPEWARARMPSALPEDIDLRDRIFELMALPSGIHSVQTEEHSYKVAVDKRTDVWGYVFYDSTPNPRERYLLLGVLAGTFFVISLLALFLARWSSKRVMAPVSDLARRIAGMGDHIHPEPLAPNYADDEVGQLAGALDEYAERLTALVIRDQEFNADVSHELRTPLAVIKSATELLMAQPDVDEKTLTRLTRIERAAKQSTELTEALLHLVRAERSARSTGEYFRVDKIVEEVIDFKKSQLGRKPVDVHLTITESFLGCAPDAVIAVSLGNLIGNAFKYTPQGSVDITVGGGRVVVEDTGPGLEDDELQRVFTRHYRGSSASGKGSGLGLAIVRRFCELYDWQVSIEPRAEGGLRATLAFSPETIREPRAKPKQRSTT
ncbi:MAG: HAMP domain-containing sensor histidine kinase [Xanthomonadales bacterium]|nr:HAMP domain-containing sensor histidine kinase [Xanthomonadales bacterium]